MAPSVMVVDYLLQSQLPSYFIALYKGDVTFLI